MKWPADEILGLEATIFAERNCAVDGSEKADVSGHEQTPHSSYVTYVFGFTWWTVKEPDGKHKAT